MYRSNYVSFSKHVRVYETDVYIYSAVSSFVPVNYKSIESLMLYSPWFSWFIEPLLGLFSEIRLLIIVAKHIEHGKDLWHVYISHWFSIWFAGGQQSLKRVTYHNNKLDLQTQKKYFQSYNSLYYSYLSHLLIKMSNVHDKSHRYKRELQKL